MTLEGLTNTGYEMLGRSMNSLFLARRANGDDGPPVNNVPVVIKRYEAIKYDLTKNIDYTVDCGLLQYDHDVLVNRLAELGVKGFVVGNMPKSRAVIAITSKMYVDIIKFLLSKLWDTYKQEATNGTNLRGV